MNRDLVYVVLACAIVAAGLIAGFIAIGPPSHARLLQLDQQRVDDLRKMAMALHETYKKSASVPNALPQDLAEKYYDTTAGFGYGYSRPDFTRDPQTHEPYAYEKVDRENYRLCATFSLPSERSQGDLPSFWWHGAGPKCYSLDASPQPFPM